jgi:hypothetical protein
MIILVDQNFPAVLPIASGSCLAIIRIDQGKIKDLVVLLFSISPEEFPPRTIFVLGSLTHLQGEGLHGYAAAGVKAGKRIASQFPDAYSVLFTPPPPPLWAGVTTASWLGKFWIAVAGSVPCPPIPYRAP